jgi:hypothetical protein
MCGKEEIDDEIKDFNSTLSPDTEVCEDTSCKVNLFSELVVLAALLACVMRAPVFILTVNERAPSPPKNAVALQFPVLTIIGAKEPQLAALLLSLSHSLFTMMKLDQSYLHPLVKHSERKKFCPRK